MKKSFKICITIICILSCMVTGVLATYASNDDFKEYVDVLIFKNASRWSYCVKDFDIYYEDFQSIANLSKEYIGELDAPQYDFLMVDHCAGEIYLSYGGKRLELNEQQKTCLKNIDQTFKCKDSNFNVVRVYDNRVSCSEEFRLIT